MRSSESFSTLTRRLVAELSNGDRIRFEFEVQNSVSVTQFLVLDIEFYFLNAKVRGNNFIREFANGTGVD